jgi:hypothetical protein
VLLLRASCSWRCGNGAGAGRRLASRGARATLIARAGTASPSPRSRRGARALVIIAGTTYARRPPSPYLGRAADLLDMALVISVVPVAAAVLGLYAKVRGIAG